ncbi:hypothetical protein OG413_20620 [Streptomyces sp. NBC_01433]|uniref:hypothetical protein n=1 Tax=Streptomyces sp. NBC_01433 TaxID=2903864 RepID=UPI002253183E|nr:hypothetical protein [Streptomyces sp. NBC_01433]MCX4677679.1 hypothetical protein [Streptomyces sp. NBC_01433]
MFPTTALEALAAVGVPGYFDTEEGLLIAHPADVSQERALSGEHVVLTPPDSMVPGWSAIAYEPDGTPDFADITVYDVPEDDITRCAQAVAQWFTDPRPSAGAVLLAALTQYGITSYDDHNGMTYAISMDPAAPAAGIRIRPHLSIGDRNGSVEHVPAAHTGWSLFAHGEDGEPVGDPLFVSGDGGLVDCDADSVAAAEVIADYLNRSAR